MINAWFELFVLCLFVCLFLFVWSCLLVFVCFVICIVCLFDLFACCLLLITVCLTIFAGIQAV